jgi:hypothetical protein
VENLFALPMFFNSLLGLLLFVLPMKDRDWHIHVAGKRHSLKGMFKKPRGQETKIETGSSRDALIS